MYKYYKELKNNVSNEKRYYRLEDSDCRHPILCVSKSTSGIMIKSISEYDFFDFFHGDYASGRIADSDCEEFEDALMTSLISLNIELK
jgi:hypothetical protein